MLNYMVTYRSGDKKLHDNKIDHGRQHKEFVEHFHRDLSGFQDSKKRDRRKLELCAEQGIKVAVFWDNEELTEDLVFQRIQIALQDSFLLKKKPSFAKILKQNASDHRKAQYIKYKESKSHQDRLDQARMARKERYERSKQRQNEDKS